MLLHLFLGQMFTVQLIQSLLDLPLFLSGTPDHSLLSFTSGPFVDRFGRLGVLIFLLHLLPFILKLLAKEFALVLISLFSELELLSGFLFKLAFGDIVIILPIFKNVVELLLLFRSHLFERNLWFWLWLIAEVLFDSFENGYHRIDPFRPFLLNYRVQRLHRSSGNLPHRFDECRDYRLVAK